MWNRPKYNNHKTVIDGIAFDSLKEANRYIDLVEMERNGEISDLMRQVKFELIPSQFVDGKCVERKCVYVADFVYVQDGKTVVEDTKGFKTKDYIIKRKLMLEKYGIRIKEV